MHRVLLPMVLAAFVGTAAEVTQVFRPERSVRTDENVRRIQPIDTAAWIWADGSVQWGESCIGRRDEAYRNVVEPKFYRFRRAFVATDEKLVFDVSADERFILLLDGREFARGPHRGAPERWFYQTYEATLPPGEHVLEAICWQLGNQAPLAQMSWRGGFILKAEGNYDAKLTTGKAEWTVSELANTMFTGKGESKAWGVGGECLIAGTSFYEEQGVPRTVVVVREPVGLTDIDLANPTDGDNGIRKPGWCLFPTVMPDQMHVRRTPGAFRAVSSDMAGKVPFSKADAADARVAALNGLLAKGVPVTVPPRTSFRAIWDLENYYCAYPELVTSGGKGAEIRLRWTESLWDETGHKGDRAAFLGKVPGLLYGDTFRCDGRARGFFTTPWWRCGRWCQLEVKTGDEPLTLSSLALHETRYPDVITGSFACDDPTIEPIRQISTRAVQECMHEMSFDCPYYEQHMYPGDSRVQYLVAGTLHADARLVKQAMTLFGDAQRPNGFVPMNYPGRMTLESGLYTLCWVNMFRDWLYWRADEDWLRARLPGARRALDGVGAFEDADGFLTKMPGWNFTDYTNPWPNGVAPYGRKDGLSAIESLQYLYSLQSFADVEERLGEKGFALHYRTKAEELARKIKGRFFSSERGLLADTSDLDAFSEQTLSFAVLTGLLTPAETAAAMMAIETDSSLTPATPYFMHFLFDAVFAAGRSDLFFKRLDYWRGYRKNNMATVPEMHPKADGRDPRSDCHAWGSHPVYHLNAHVAGIKPSAPGFRSVRIAPQPGPLKFVKATTPTPQGPVSVDLRFADGRVEGTVTLPADLRGTFVWNGKECPLAPGVNVLAQVLAEPTLTADAAALLKNWCDAMIRYQVLDTSDSRVRGSFLCPACAHQHGRVCDVAYPMAFLYARTGERKYLDSATAAVDWCRRNLTREGGGRLDNDFQCKWWGISVFSQCAIGKALLTVGDRLPANVRSDWRVWFDLQTAYIEDRLNVEGHFNVNYSAAYCEALALAWKLTGKASYLEKARKLAKSLEVYFLEDGMLAGEKHPPTFVSPHGFRAVDIGYNMEESLPSLYHFAELTGDESYAKKLDRLASAHLEFVLPDGGIDGSAGSRAEKWSYWGSRTSDGAMPLFAAMAKRGLSGGWCAAERHLALLRRCTSRESHLLAGGLHYDEADEGACIHHTFAHAKSLADFLAEMEGVGVPDDLGDLPRSRVCGFKQFPSFGTTLASVGPWRATFTVNDVHHNEGGTMCGGGSPTLLWHEKCGLVLAGTFHTYSTIEHDNMQSPRHDPDVRCMTPRLEGEGWSSDCDAEATADVRMDGDVLIYVVKGRHHAVTYELTAGGLTIRATGDGAWRYVLPVDVNAADRVTVRTNGKLTHEPSAAGRHSFTPVAGLLTDYQVIQPPADGSLVIEFGIK